jgi:hypothetical protein
VLLPEFYQKTDEKVGVNFSTFLNGQGGVHLFKSGGWLHEAISDNAEKVS